MLAIKLYELAAKSEAGQLLEQKPALTPAAETQFAHQLLVGGLTSGGGGDARHEFAISHTPRLEPVLHFARAKINARLQATLKVTLRRRGGGAGTCALP